MSRYSRFFISLHSYCFLEYSLYIWNVKCIKQDLNYVTNNHFIRYVHSISRVLSWIKTYKISFADQAALPYQWQLETNLGDELMLSKPQLITLTHKPTTTLITHICVTAIRDVSIVLGNFKWMAPAADAVMTQKRFPYNLWGEPTCESICHICSFSTQSNMEFWFFVFAVSLKPWSESSCWVF